MLAVIIAVALGEVLGHLLIEWMHARKLKKARSLEAASGSAQSGIDSNL